MFNLHPNTIRFYESIGYISKLKENLMVIVNLQIKIFIKIDLIPNITCLSLFL